MKLEERWYLYRMLPIYLYKHKYKLTIDDIDCSNKEVLNYIRDKITLKIKEMESDINNNKYDMIIRKDGKAFYRIKDWSKRGYSRIDSIFRGIGRIQERTLDYSPLVLKTKFNKT